MSSHGEAGRFFVSFLDNHDQKERIQHPDTPAEQVTLAIALLFTLQGVPSLYYGTEQGFRGTVDASGNPDLVANESSREALWGKPNAFDTNAATFKHVQALSRLRDDEPPLRDIYATPVQMKVPYSNRGGGGTGTSRTITNARFFRDGQVSAGPAAAIDVVLQAREVQVLMPA